MSKKAKPDLSDILHSDYGDMLHQMDQLKHKVETMKPGAKKPAPRLSAKSEKHEMAFDNIVTTNVIGDYHRILQDVLDGSLNVVRSQDPMHPAEIQRRAAGALVDEVAEMVSQKWRDFTPRAGRWQNMTPLEARKSAIASLRAEFAHDIDGFASTVAAEVVESFFDRGNKPVPMGRVELTKAVNAGMEEGTEIVLGLFRDLKRDMPGLNMPGRDPKDYIKAVMSASGVAHNQATRHFNGLVMRPTNEEELATKVYATLVEQKMSDALNLFSFGTINSGVEPPQQLRLFAGSVLTSLGLPQIYDEVAVNDEELKSSLQDRPQAAPDDDDDDEVGDSADELKEMGYEPPALLENGRPTETLKALQLREIHMVFNNIGASLARGDLQQVAQERMAAGMKRLAKKQGNAPKLTAAQQAMSPSEWLVHTLEADAARTKSNGAAKTEISKAADLKGWERANDMIEDTLMGISVKMMRADGWVADSSKLRSYRQKEAFVNAMKIDPKHPRKEAEPIVAMRQHPTIQ